MLVHFRRGVLPIAKKVLLQESQGWLGESINTMAIPLTFFLAFGLGLQGYIAKVDGVPYINFLAPGLITMTLLQEAYRTGVWGLWLDRWHQRTLDEYRIKPVFATDIIMGEIIGSFLVALIKGLIVGLIIMAFSPVAIHWAALPQYFLLVFPCCVLFTCVGTIVGTSFAKPDQIAQSQTIFITPLLYLGGLFFPVSALPKNVQDAVYWLPTTAAFEGGRNLLLHGHISTHFLVLMWVSAAISFALATWLFQKNLSE